jgi:hypothetical protein
MAIIKDHPTHVQEDHTYGNPRGTDGQFANFREYPDDEFPDTPGPIADKYGLIQIVAKYNRYAGTGTGGVSTMTDSSSPQWADDRWENWFMQDKNGVRYRIVSNGYNFLTLGGPYDIPSGVYYIIHDRDFAGFEIFECTIDETTSPPTWKPANEQPLFNRMNTQLTEGGTSIIYYVNKELNAYYYFLVNTIDMQGNRSIDSFKNRTRVWVGKEPPLPEPPPDTSLRGTFDYHGYSTWGWVRDSTKSWETGNFGYSNDYGKHFVNITNSFGRIKTYRILYNETDKLYLYMKGVPSLGQYAIFLDESTTEEKDLPGRRRPPGDGDDDEPDPNSVANVQPSWFIGGAIEK